MEDLKYIGFGMYGVAEAARLLRRPVRQVCRWANGYTYKRTYDQGSKPPILQTDRADKQVLTFRELIELTFVREFETAGVPIGNIRDTADALEKTYGPYPLASANLICDGRQLLRVSDHGLITPATCQLVADFAADFVKEIHFENDFARTWTPVEGHGSVIIDPARQFGEPILIGHGTPTRTIYRTYIKEQDLQKVADWYELACTDVKNAVEFEMRFANAA